MLGFLGTSPPLLTDFSSSSQETCLSSKYSHLRRRPSFFREYVVLGYLGGRADSGCRRRLAEMQAGFLSALFRRNFLRRRMGAVAAEAIRGG